LFPALSLPSYPAKYSSSLTFSFFNINGATSHKLRAEHPILHDLIATYSSDILMFADTHLISKHPTITNYSLLGFTAASSTRTNLRGGLAIYVNQYLSIFHLLECSKTHDIMWIKISAPDDTLFLCFCYFRPSNSQNKQYNHSLSIELSLLAKYSAQGSIITLGTLMPGLVISPVTPAMTNT